MSIAEKLQTIAENEQRVYDAGRQAEYDGFWDAYQENGNRYHWNNAFGNKGWNEKTYNPKYPINKITYAGNMFQTSQITDTKLALNFSQVSLNACANVFSSCSALTIVRTLTVAESNTYAGWFTGCKELLTITFEGTIGESISFVDSSKLTNASVQNIIDHLADLTGKTRKTLTLNAQVYVSDTQKAEIENLNWSLVQ